MVFVSRLLPDGAEETGSICIVLRAQWNINVGHSGVDDRFRMVVPVYMDYGDVLASPG